MFDETLNQNSNTEQVDQHVDYWAGPVLIPVSQFMGRAAANDLLKHIKVRKYVFRQHVYFNQSIFV